MESSDQNRAFIQAILDAIADPIFVKDEAHRWIYGNAAFSRLLGLKPEEYIGKTDHDLFSKEMADYFWAKDDEVLAGGRPVEFEEPINQPGGSVMIALTKKVPFKDADGKSVLVGVIRDITARKKLESELDEIRAVQIHSARMAALGEMSSGIAHEINNPLAVILGLSARIADSIKEGTPPDAESLASQIEKIEINSTRIVKIIKGLRSFARQGESDPVESVQVLGLVEDALSLCSERYKTHGVKLVVSPIDPGLRVSGISTQLAQILINLLNNAFDSVETLPVREIHLEAARRGSSVEIRVWDSGPGVSHHIEHRIMEPFFTTKPVGRGTGLGLSISLGIAKRHMGTLALDRTRGPSCFVLTLPEL